MLAAREEESFSEAVADGWIFAGRSVSGEVLEVRWVDGYAY